MRLTGLLLSLVLAATLAADGTVTVPQNIAPASWKIAQIEMQNGAGTDIPLVRIVLYYFDAQAVIVRRDSILLAGAEISSFITVTNSPVTGESGSAVKRYRQRVTKWLIDNGKITNVTPE